MQQQHRTKRSHSGAAVAVKQSAKNDSGVGHRKGETTLGVPARQVISILTKSEGRAGQN